jgi:hypothetical protein
MRSCFVVMFDVFPEDSAKVAFAHDEDMARGTNTLDSPTRAALSATISTR